MVSYGGMVEEMVNIYKAAANPNALKTDWYQ